MDVRMITVSSQTIAIKAQRMLRKNGIRCKIVRPSPSQTPHGCGFGLQVDVYSVAAAMDFLEAADIPFGDVVG